MIKQTTLQSCFCLDLPSAKCFNYDSLQTALNFGNTVGEEQRERGELKNIKEMR